MAIMRAYAADYNAYVEPLRDADSAGWTPTNSVATSNHLNGTAMDLNWDSHPFQVSNAGYSPQMIATMRDLLDFYEGTMFWAQDWDSPKDCMHHQMGYDTFGDPHTADFIARKIRADGYSTYRRGAAPSVMTVPLTENANGTWTSPSPAWAHLIMRESSGNPTIIQQIIDVNSGGNEAEGLFQITPATWRAHGGLEFAATPRLATPQQQAIVAARILTRNPSGSDWGAGLPGREDATQLANGLVPTTTTTTTGVFMALTDAEQRELLDLARQIAAYRRDSRSPLRHLGEHNVDTATGLAINTDGNVHVLLVERLAKLGDPDALALLREVANADPAKYPDRRHDAQLAQAILNEIAGVGTADTAPPSGQTPGTIPTPVAVPPAPVAVPPPPVQVPPSPPAVPPAGGGISSGVDAVDADLATLRATLADLTEKIRS